MIDVMNNVVVDWTYAVILSICCPLTSLLFVSQRASVTAAVVPRGSRIRTSVTRAPVSARVCSATAVYSVRTARRGTSPTAPAAASPVPATPSVQ